MIEARPSPLLKRWFRWYNRRFIAKNFFRVHIAPPFPVLERRPGVPLVILLSHSSWWDVLIGFFLSDLWELSPAYGVMDDLQLRRYRMFSRLGLYGLDRSSRAGLSAFVRYSERLLKNTQAAVWICPQGDIVSNRRRPLAFFNGVGHVAKRLERADLLCVAVDYELRGERRPEAFVSVSRVMRADGVSSADAMTRACEREMQSLLDGLQSRMLEDPGGFRTLIEGSTAVNPAYDGARWLLAAVRGRRFVRAHGGVRSRPDGRA